MLTIEDGLIVENRAYMNATEMARQLGAMPPAGSLPEKAMFGALNAKTAAVAAIRGNLSALGFMIDMLSVQPQLAKSLFVFDAEKGTLAPLMGRAGPGMAEPAPVEPHLIEAAQMLAFSSVREDVPLQEVTFELERLIREKRRAVDRGIEAVF